MSWTVSFTIHLWWLWAYLGIGAALWLPLKYRAYQRTRESYLFWSEVRFDVRRRLWAPLVAVVIWPAALWEAFK